MKATLNKSFVLPTALLALIVLPPPRIAAQEAAGYGTATCAAATPVPNPWAKGLPEGWWTKRHEGILSAPNRAECQIVFVGDSITDGWDEKGAGLDIWNKEYAPLHAVNLGIVCDSTQHVLWRILHGEVDGLSELKVVVVEIGVNNKGICRHSEEDVEKGIIAVCDALRQKAPQVRIILMGVFPRYFGWDTSDTLNRNLARMHDGKRVFFVNINKRLEETEGAIADAVGHLTATGYQVWADSIRSTIENLLATDVRFQDPIGVVTEAPTAFRDGGDDGKARKIVSCRAATPARSARTPRIYMKNFIAAVWGNRFERRKSEVAFLGSTATHNIPKDLWDRELAPLKAYNLGMPGERTENVLWRVDNGAVDRAWSRLKLLVLEVGTDNKRDPQDSAEDIAAGIEAICNRVKANTPQAKILLMGLFPPFSGQDKHEEVNSLIAKLADNEKVFFLDINEALLKTRDAVAEDGVTLTVKGYKIWAEQIGPIIGKVIGLPAGTR